LYEPTQEDPSHCIIIKKTNSADIDKKIRRKLVSITQIVKV